MFRLILFMASLMTGTVRAQTTTANLYHAPPPACASGVSVYNDDAVELAKSVTAKEDKQTKGDVIIVKKEVKTTGGATFTCEIFSDKTSGKTVQVFEGRKTTCTLLPAAVPSTARAGGHRIPAMPANSSPYVR